MFSNGMENDGRSRDVWLRIEAFAGCSGKAREAECPFMGRKYKCTYLETASLCTVPM